MIRPVFLSPYVPSEQSRVSADVVLTLKMVQIEGKRIKIVHYGKYK
jgi:hypothetical protein